MARMSTTLQMEMQGHTHDCDYEQEINDTLHINIGSHASYRAATSSSEIFQFEVGRVTSELPAVIRYSCCCSQSLVLWTQVAEGGMGYVRQPSAALSPRQYCHRDWMNLFRGWGCFVGP